MKDGRRGFTLIELLVVMAVIGTLLAIAMPRYTGTVDRSRDTALKQTLSVTRDAIDKFYGDTGRYPDALEELVEKRYLRSMPLDPVTNASTTWVFVPPPVGAAKGGIYDLRSGAPGNGRDGSPYAQW
jgi:prepilin-type N-terminal cleavage/methylation domain-containing protein